MERKILCFLVF